jgi:hypothetical protein
VGDAAAWSESYYFNFVDPVSKIAMFTRMGFRPKDGFADGLHVVYLGGDRVAFTYGITRIGEDLKEYDDNLAAGSLQLQCIDPFKHWRVGFDGDAQDIENAEILLMRRKERPEGWYKPARLSMQVDFNAITEPHYAAAGEKGHFEQAGRVQGMINLGDETWSVNGFGVRDKSWGPRDWGAGNSNTADTTIRPADAGKPSPFVNWFSMNFGDKAALGGSCFRDKAGVMRGQGWYQHDGVSELLPSVIIESDYGKDSIWHTEVELNAETEGGQALVIKGKVLTVCPTKIAMPGGATFVNEGLAEFEMNGMTGYGISEHWHAITKQT